MTDGADDVLMVVISINIAMMSIENTDISVVTKSVDTITMDADGGINNTISMGEDVVLPITTNNVPHSRVGAMPNPEVKLLHSANAAADVFGAGENFDPMSLPMSMAANVNEVFIGGTSTMGIFI